MKSVYKSWQISVILLELGQFNRNTAIKKYTNSNSTPNLTYINFKTILDEIFKSHEKLKQIWAKQWKFSYICISVRLI